ncbi:MAG TPA: hypothetical protein VLK89_00215 [Solirubrobacterales bacterium]|nr:hypothetical protein [Solirubrobacterales bacterium]
MIGDATFDPGAFETFRFTGRSIDREGRVALRYALDDQLEFEERFELPVPADAGAVESETVQQLLALLHWVAGVSYYKTAAPPRVAFEGEAPPPATARLLEALYSEGLGEFAVVNDLPALPHPAFPVGNAPSPDSRPGPPRRVLVPVGGGKDSAVALEIVRRSKLELALFSVGTAPPIDRTVDVAGLSRLLVRRHLDPQLQELNRSGALNGHIPVTAIIAAAALLTAELHGFDAVALANERSASIGNTVWNGVEVNHQFSKSARAEELLRDAVSELAAHLRVFSVLRPASELSIARAFARLRQYHPAFTSCNRIFRLDPALRASSWCGDCDKCRFVFLILAPFLDPDVLEEIFGRAMLDDPEQYAGFALLTGTGGHKPFECVGEIDDSVAAIRLLAGDPRWNQQRVVRRLADEVLPRFGSDEGSPSQVLELTDDHAVPTELIDDVHALLGA